MHKRIQKQELGLFSLALVLVSLLYTIYFLLIGKPVFGSNDDIGIQMILSGVWAAPEPSVDALYANYLLGHLIVPLFKAFPDRPWYVYFLLSAQILGFSTLLYANWRLRFNIWSIILGALVVFGTMMPAIWHFQFTIISLVVIASGILLFLSAKTQPAKSKTSQLAILSYSAVLVVLGTLIRYNSGLIIGAALGPFVAVKGFLWLVQHHKLNDIKKGASTILSVLVVLSVVYVLRQLDRQHYKNNPNWEEWVDINIAKSQFIDYDFLRYSEKTKPYYDKIGWTKNDAHLICSWQYLDPKIYSRDNLMTMYNSLSAWRGIENLESSQFEEYEFTFSQVSTDALRYIEDCSFIPWLILIILFLMFNTWRNKIALLVLVSTFLALSGYLVFGLERYPFRIIISLWMVFTWALFLLKSCDNENKHIGDYKHFMRLGGAFIILLTAQEYFREDVKIAHEKYTEAKLEQIELTKKLERWASVIPEKGVLYIIGSTFQYEKHLPLNSLRSFNKIKNVVSAGWNNHSHNQKLVIEALDMSPNFYESAIKREDIYFLIRENHQITKGELNYLRTYYNEHHKVQLFAEPVENQTDIGKLSFTPLDSITTNAPELLSRFEEKKGS